MDTGRGVNQLSVYDISQAQDQDQTHTAMPPCDKAGSR